MNKEKHLTKIEADSTAHAMEQLCCALEKGDTCADAYSAEDARRLLGLDTNTTIAEQKKVSTPHGELTFSSNHITFYLEKAASFLASRYKQYWFILIPSCFECSASDRWRLRGILNLNCPE